jgi:hypothetical protein
MLVLDKSSLAHKLQPSLLVKSGSSDFAFAADFTLEIFKAKFADTASGCFLANFNSASPFANQQSWEWDYLSGTGMRFIGNLVGTNNVVTTITYTWTPTTGVDYDLAVDRSGSAVRLYVNGAKVANGTIAGALWASTDTYLAIGQVRTGNGVTNLWTGQAKAIRITDGVARYATNGSYTVPSLPLPTS